jgi:hypothetical protein
MRWLTVDSGSLLDLIDMDDDVYTATKAEGTAGVTRQQIFPVLDKARRIVRSAAQRESDADQAQRAVPADRTRIGQLPDHHGRRPDLDQGIRPNPARATDRR